MNDIKRGHVEILHFSDLLCVWAYVTQLRMEQLEATFADKISISAHFVPVFGDVRTKLASWAERGGVAGYAEHVRGICARYGLDSVHEQCWVGATPRSSLSCHIYLHAICAAEHSDALAAGSMHAVAKAMRAAFFEQARDVSQRSEQRDIAASCELDVDAIEAHIETGEAHASLNRDIELVRAHDVRMSPTLVFNEGRQRLNGNVGYRVIEANIRELLERDAQLASWC